MSRTIEVIVCPRGDLRLETKGFLGGACREASRLLEQGLGLKTKDQVTPDYYAQISAVQQAQQGGTTL